MFVGHIIFASIFIICVIITIVGAIIQNSSYYYDDEEIGFGLALGGLLFGVISFVVGLPLGLCSQGALKQYHHEYAITTLKESEDSFILGIYTKKNTSYYVYRYEVSDNTYSTAKKPVSNCVIYEISDSNTKVVIDKQKYNIEEKVKIYVPVNYKCVVWEAI